MFSTVLDAIRRAQHTLPAAFSKPIHGPVCFGVATRTRSNNDLAVGTGSKVPTWSWASIDAPVLFYEANARHKRKPQLDPSTMDPKLRHAEIKLEINDFVG